MSAPSPASIQGGRVVRLLARHRTWVSSPLTAEQAEALASLLTSKVADIGDAPGLVFFRCGDGREAAIRARELVAIEHQACTEAPHILPVRTAEEIAESVVRL